LVDLGLKSSMTWLRVTTEPENDAVARHRPISADIVLQDRSAIAYVQPMTQRVPVADHVETEAERQARLAWEAEGIAEADAELDAGLYVDVAEMRAWIDSLRTDSPLPPPPTRRS